MRTLALVDGEHYPPVTRAALEVGAGARPRDRGRAPGGWDGEARAPATIRPTSACPSSSSADEPMACPARPRSPTSRRRSILDLSDEPVLGYRERMELVAVALAAGVPYLGPDFRLDPPEHGPPLAGADARGHRHRQADRQDRDRRSGRPPGGPPRSRAGRRRDGPRRAAGAHRRDGRLGRPRPPRAAGRRKGSTRPPTTWRTPSPPASPPSAHGAPAAGSPARPTPPTSGRPPSWRPPSPRARDPGGERCRRSRRSPGTRASSWCPPPRLPSTWAATSAPTGSCGRTWWLLPWLATHPGPKTFPRSVPLFGATWTMRRSS